MEAKKKDSKGDLKDIVLNDDSNLILPEVSFPASYDTAQPIKYGAKSTEQKLASQHELLEYQKRISRKDSTLTPEDIGRLTIEAAERRRSLEQSILLQKQEFEYNHNLQIKERQAKALAEARATRIAHENDTQRAIRIASEEQIKINRAKEIQALENRCRKEKEDVTVFFEQSSNRFSQKYGNATKKVSGETGIDRLVSSRTFSTNRYAHRCIVCGYHNPESLSISKIYQHIFDKKDLHMDVVLSEIDGYYNRQIADTRKRHSAEDNPDLKQQKLSKDLEALKKLKGVNYR